MNTWEMTASWSTGTPTLTALFEHFFSVFERGVLLAPQVADVLGRIKARRCRYIGCEVESYESQKNISIEHSNFMTTINYIRVGIRSFKRVSSDHFGSTKHPDHFNRIKLRYLQKLPMLYDKELGFLLPLHDFSSNNSFIHTVSYINKSLMCISLILIFTVLSVT